MWAVHPTHSEGPGGLREGRHSSSGPCGHGASVRAVYMAATSRATRKPLLCQRGAVRHVQPRDSQGSVHKAAVPMVWSVGCRDTGWPRGLGLLQTTVTPSTCPAGRRGASRPYLGTAFQLLTNPPPSRTLCSRERPRALGAACLCPQGPTESWCLSPSHQKPRHPSHPQPPRCSPHQSPKAGLQQPPARSQRQRPGPDPPGGGEPTLGAATGRAGQPHPLNLPGLPRQAPHKVDSLAVSWEGRFLFHSKPVRRAARPRLSSTVSAPTAARAAAGANPGSGHGRGRGSGTNTL